MGQTSERPGGGSPAGSQGGRVPRLPLTSHPKPRAKGSQGSAPGGLLIPLPPSLLSRGWRQGNDGGHSGPGGVAGALQGQRGGGRPSVART